MSEYDDFEINAAHSMSDDSTLPLNQEESIVIDDDSQSPAELSPAIATSLATDITQLSSSSVSASGSTTSSEPIVADPRTVHAFPYSAALLAMAPALIKSDNNSEVWNHWALQKDNNCIAHCLICRQKGKSAVTIQRKGSNTSNMWTHLRVVHAVQKKPSASDVDVASTKRRKREFDAEQPTLDNMRGFSAERLSHAHQLESWQMLFDVMVHNYWSMNSIDQEKFTAYVKFISNNRYTTPTRYQLTKMIYETTEALRKSMFAVVRDQKFISLTTDASDCNGKSYVVVTANFITSNWQMVDMCLSVSEVSKSHSHDVICSLLLDCCELWTSNRSVQAIVTDNGANFLAGVRDFVKKFPERVCDNIRCACHTLHLCVYHALVFPKSRKKKGTNNVHPTSNNSSSLSDDEPTTLKRQLVALIARCRNVITKIKNSKTNLAPALALKLQQDRTLTSVRKVKCRQLLTDNVTRWNSTLNMIESLIPQFEEVNDVLIADLQSELCFTAADQAILKELVILLTPMKCITKMLEAGKSVTISLVYGLIYWLINIFNGTDVGTWNLTKIYSPVVINAKKKILFELETRFIAVTSNVITTNVYAMATLLDPRTKTMKTIPTTMQDAFKKVLNAQYNLAKTNITTTFDVNESNASHSVSLCQAAFGMPSPYTNRATDELRQYMLEPMIQLESCPLLWWKTRELRFPTLAVLARKYLGIPASSASSERMWSVGGLLVTKHRNRMQSDNITQLMFIKQNSKVAEQLGLAYSISDVISQLSAVPDDNAADNV